ncbi:MAG: hypothetical protein U1E56_00395 [Bauldia sp.]
MSLTTLERVDEPLAPGHVFARRLAFNLVIFLTAMALSLLAGMAGYHAFEGLSWLDAFASAAMILSGMGPFGELHSTAGKLFAGFYALYSGLFFIASTGLLLGPLFHRIMHRLHMPDDADEAGK